MDRYTFIEKLSGKELHGFQKALVDEIMFREIEEAMGFKLYDLQKDYIIGARKHLGYDPNNRRRGLTTAHCIKLALSDGPAINLHKMHEHCDMQHFTRDQMSHYRHYYRDTFLFIRNKLEDQGFKVRDVYK